MTTELLNLKAVNKIIFLRIKNDKTLDALEFDRILG
jgi:hypothetical protein